MTALTKRTATSPLSELFDWLETGWPTVAELRREGAHVMRIEDRMEDDRYVVRAELPGIDPDKDVEISVADGVLTISAERHEGTAEKGRSDYDIAHRFVLSYTYELPFARNLTGPAKVLLDGWQILGIHAFNTGNPYTISARTNFSSSR